MADLSFKEERARQWMMDVQNEIQLVHAELQKVNSEAEITPGDEDTILQGIQKCNTAMQDGWTRLCNGFTEATNKVNGAIESLVKVVTQQRQDVDNLTARMK